MHSASHTHDALFLTNVCAHTSAPALSLLMGQTSVFGDQGMLLITAASIDVWIMFHDTIDRQTDLERQLLPQHAA